jgi:cation diffusion facilitator CzcD-associated flavoprotein CzcO
MDGTDRSPRSAGPSIAIIGTGFGGIGVARYLKQAGLSNFTIFEKKQDVGGVWRENTYPGAACDIPSHLYSYSFEPHYPWSRRYGTQSEIHAYLRHCAQKYQLVDHIRFGHEMLGAQFDAARGVWVIRFANGLTHEAQVLISAVGQLHRPQLAEVPGLASFAGRSFHSATWDHSYDLSGKTVAVIGTGASAVQFVPEIAPQVQQLYLFQRSAGWVIPKMDRPYSTFERMLLTRVPALHSADRARIFWFIEFLASALQRTGALKSRIAAAIFTIANRFMMKTQLRDPALRQKLSPDSPLGCKRTLLSNKWLPALARPNVEVVTESIREIVPTGVITADGQLRKVDALIHGTGFAASEFLAPMDLLGLDGQSLRAVWAQGAEAHLGITVSGFPNLFVMYGPNTNLGAGSIIYMLEAQARYVTEAVSLLRDRQLRWLNVKPQAQAAFISRIRDASKQSPYESGCHSWYINAQGRNINNWLGYMADYGKLTAQVNPDEYELEPA